MLRSKGLVAVDVSLLQVLMQVFVTLFQKAFSSTKLPGRGIRVFAAFLYTHLQGTVIRELRLDSRKKKPIRTKPFCKQFLSPLPYTLDILCGLNARFSFTLCWLPMMTINLPQLLYLFTYDKTSWIFQAVQHGPSIIETVLNYQKLREMITTIITSRYSLFWAI